MTAALFAVAGDFDGLVNWRLGDLYEANVLLTRSHYLGPILSGGCELVVVGDVDGSPVAAQVWRRPTSRRLPSDGSWLELSRWCLTSAAGEYAGSRQHRAAVRLIRQRFPQVTTLVSYSDPMRGHTGALYRACNWRWAPTWLRLRPPPSGQGAWSMSRAESVKDRWIFAVRRDANRQAVVFIDDEAAIRHWCLSAPDVERRWATWHPQLSANELIHEQEGASR